MTIGSLSRFVLACSLFTSFTASAVPGLWQQGYGQGALLQIVGGDKLIIPFC